MKKTEKENPKIKACNVKTLNFDSLDEYVEENAHQTDQKNLDETGWNFYNTESSNLLEKIKQNSAPLKEYVGKNVYRGVLTGYNKAFVIDERTKAELIRQDAKSAEIIKPFLTGNEVTRYAINPKGRYIIFTRHGINVDNYPTVKKHLEKFREDLTPKKSRTQKTGRKPGDYKWYEIQDTIAYYKEFEKPKIIYGKITTKPRFTIDTDGYLVNDSNFFFPIVDFRLLGILNSRLGWFLIKNTCTQVRGGYQLIWKYLGKVPITKTKSAKLDDMVEKILSLQKECHDKTTGREKEQLEQQIKQIDWQIDQEVYKLYGITKEEQRIIEESLK